MIAAAAWPWRGLGWFLARPWLWWLPVLAQMALVAAVTMGGVTVGGALWPGQTSAWWWREALAVGGGVVGGALLWLTLAPLVTALVLDRLAAEVLRERGIAAAPCPWHAAIGHALAMIARTLPSRLGWTGVMLLSGASGPLAPLLAGYCVSRLACLDAFDTALAAIDPRQGFRAEGLERHQADRIAGALGAQALKLLLALPVVGLLLWMPALVCGAALRVAERRAAPGDQPPIAATQRA